MIDGELFNNNKVESFLFEFIRFEIESLYLGSFWRLKYLFGDKDLLEIFYLFNKYRDYGFRREDFDNFDGTDCE